MIDNRLQKAIDYEVSLVTGNALTSEHFTFDSPTFDYLVPDFDDVAWINLAYEIVEAVKPSSQHLLFELPLIELDERPTLLMIDEIRTLTPWQPPALFFTGKMDRVFELRVRDEWFSDDLDQVDGAHAWLSGTYKPIERAWQVTMFLERIIPD